MRSFVDRVAVVTGAASGIGRALARTLAERGCDLALVDLNEEGLTEVAGEVRQLGRHSSVHVVDVADREQMSALPEAVEQAHGQVDILVNNAGVSVAATLEEHSLEDFEWLVGINLWGVVYGCKFFLPLLKASDDAYIVNLSSMFGIIGVPGQSSYCATKFAVRGFSESIGAELANTNVRVMSVHPGGIRTNIVKAARWTGGQAKARDRLVSQFERLAMPPDRAARRIVRGMERKSARVLVATEAHVTDIAKRLFPTVPGSWLAAIHARVTGGR